MKNKVKTKIYRGYKSKDDSMLAYVFGNPDKANEIINEREETCSQHINIGGSCMNCGKDMSVPSYDDIVRKNSCEKES